LKKCGRDWKIRLIEEQNPGWVDPGDSQLTFVVMDSGSRQEARPGMTKENKNPGVAVGVCISWITRSARDPHITRFRTAPLTPHLRYRTSVPIRP